MDRQAVGIVNLRAEVRARRIRLILAEKIHRRERRKAEFRNLLPQKDACAYFHERIDAGLQHESVSTRDTARVQQRVDRQLRSAGIGAFYPELGERRKFLARRERGVDRETSR